MRAGRHADDCAMDASRAAAAQALAYACLQLRQGLSHLPDLGNGCHCQSERTPLSEWPSSFQNCRQARRSLPTSRLVVPYPQKAETLLPASMFVVSENYERADVRNATNRNDWGCLNGWSDC